MRGLRAGVPCFLSRWCKFSQRAAHQANGATEPKPAALEAFALSMAFLFKKDQPKPASGFHAIDISNLPDPRADERDSAEAALLSEAIIAAVRIQTGLRMLRARRAAQDLRGARVQTVAVTCLQSFARGAAARTLARRQQEALEEEALQQHSAASMLEEQYRDNHPPEGGVVGWGGEASSSSSAEGAAPPPDAFVIRNLDTGEAVSLELSAGDASGKDLKLSFGTLQQNPQAWEALKADSKGAPTPSTAHLAPPTSSLALHRPTSSPRAKRHPHRLLRRRAGLLEKLASSTTLSFRSYQLCVWQERYVYASDDALCYQHLSADMQPTGSTKQIPYSSIEFVGACVRLNPAYRGSLGCPGQHVRRIGHRAAGRGSMRVGLALSRRSNPRDLCLAAQVLSTSSSSW